MLSKSSTRLGSSAFSREMFSATANVVSISSISAKLTNRGKQANFLYDGSPLCFLR